MSSSSSSSAPSEDAREVRSSDDSTENPLGIMKSSSTSSGVETSFSASSSSTGGGSDGSRRPSRDVLQEETIKEEEEKEVPSLLNLPQGPLQRILSHLNVFDIRRLRLTSKTLRKKILDGKWDHVKYKIYPLKQILPRFGTVYDSLIQWRYLHKSEVIGELAFNKANYIVWFDYKHDLAIKFRSGTHTVNSGTEIKLKRGSNVVLQYDRYGDYERYKVYTILDLDLKGEERSEEPAEYISPSIKFRPTTTHTKPFAIDAYPPREMTYGVDFLVNFWAIKYTNKYWRWRSSIMKCKEHLIDRRPDGPELDSYWFVTIGVYFEKFIMIYFACEDKEYDTVLVFDLCKCDGKSRKDTSPAFIKTILSEEFGQAMVQFDNGRIPVIKYREYLENVIEKGKSPEGFLETFRELHSLADPEKIHEKIPNFYYDDYLDDPECRDYKDFTSNGTNFIFHNKNRTKFYVLEINNLI